MKIVEVTWIDAQSSMDVITISDLEKQGLFITKSCGYLVKEDEDKIILGFMLFGFNANDEPLLKHYQIIPKGMVKKIKIIGNKNK